MQEGIHGIHELLVEIRRAGQQGDRGKLASIRRGFSDATAIYAWPYIAPYCDMTDEKQRAVWLTVAAAAATLMPEGLERTNVGNMGATMRRLALGDGSGKKSDEALKSFEARFRRLLSCQTTQELCRHLVRVIRAAVAKGKPVDVTKLFFDLCDWEARDVRVEWAQGYWIKEQGYEAKGEAA